MQRTIKGILHAAALALAGLLGWIALALTREMPIPCGLEPYRIWREGACTAFATGSPHFLLAGLSVPVWLALVCIAPVLASHLPLSSKHGQSQRRVELLVACASFVGAAGISYYSFSIGVPFHWAKIAVWLIAFLVLVSHWPTFSHSRPTGVAVVAATCMVLSTAGLWVWRDLRESGDLASRNKIEVLSASELFPDGTRVYGSSSATTKFVAFIDPDCAASKAMLSQVPGLVAQGAAVYLRPVSAANAASTLRALSLLQNEKDDAAYLRRFSELSSGSFATGVPSKPEASIASNQELFTKLASKVTPLVLVAQRDGVRIAHRVTNLATYAQD